MKDQTLPRPIFNGKYAWEIPVARQPVTEIKCSRCPKVEYKAIDKEEKIVVGPLMAEPILTIIFEGEVFKFDDLCSKCRKTIKSHLVNVTKDLKQGRKHGGGRSQDKT